MTIKHYSIAILVISAIITLILQLNLTRAILFENYLNTGEIFGGRGYYLALVVESAKGNWNLGSPYLMEWKNAKFLYPALNINSVGFLKKIFGLDAKETIIATHYIALFILCALALSAFLILFRGSWIGYILGSIYLFNPFARAWNQFISPEVNFIFFFLFLIVFVSRASFWLREAGLAITAGLLFYTYPYHWTFALVLLVFSDIFIFVRERKIVWRLLCKYFLIVAIGSWYFVNLWQIHRLPYYEESVRRIGLLYSHFPAGLYTQAAVILLIVLFFYTKKFLFHGKEMDLLDSTEKIVTGLLVSLVMLNQQLITGMQLEFNSHYLPVISFFIIAMIGNIIYIVMRRSFQTKKLLFVLLLLVLFGFIGKWIWNEIHTNEYTGSSNLWGAPALKVANWFQKNHIHNAVVYSPPTINNMITDLTENYLFFDDAQELQLIPTSELIDRFTYFDITNNDITENPIRYQNQIFGHTYDAVWQKDNVIARLSSIVSLRPFVPRPLSNYVTYDFKEIQKKRRAISAGALNEQLTKYHVDYVIYLNQAHNDIYRSLPGVVVYDNGFYVIKKRLSANL